METIHKGFGNVTAICGLQKTSEGRRLRPSTYMISSECDEGKLLYNTLTGELLLLASDESLENEPVRHSLTEKWFFVPEDFDEIRFTEQIRTTVGLLTPKLSRLSGFKIFTTSDCNARCFYCFENGSRKITMSDKTAHDTADFIIENCKGEKVNLSWFGGEPLYNSRAIDVIVNDLIAAGVEYESKMTSNGYLFDSETTAKAKELWKLKQVQITLDGTEKKYNQIKAYIYKNDSAYNTVLENIGRLLDSEIQVNVRFNLCGTNFEDLLMLADELNERFPNKKRLHAYCALVFDHSGRAIGFDNEKDSAAKTTELENKLIASGLREPKCLKDEYGFVQCMAADDSCVTVLPDGHLGKCEHFIDNGFIGNIYEGITDKEAVNAWKQRKQPIELCKTCAAFPICNTYLKNCPGNLRECSEISRECLIDVLKRWMYNTYIQKMYRDIRE